jgi:NAD(P)H dehydrogenase (quinone)
MPVDYRPRILVIFTSMSGHTEALARAIADGAKGGQNVEVEVRRAREVAPPDLERAAAVAFGSPTYFSYMSGELKSLFDGLLPYRQHLEGKPAMAFATGDGGQLRCVESIESILAYFGASLLEKSDILSAGLAVQGMPDEGARRLAMQAGKRLSDAGSRYVCDRARREQDVTYGVHTGR